MCTGFDIQIHSLTIATQRSILISGEIPAVDAPPYVKHNIFWFHSAKICDHALKLARCRWGGQAVGRLTIALVRSTSADPAGGHRQRHHARFCFPRPAGMSCYGRAGTLCYIAWLTRSQFRAIARVPVGSAFCAPGQAISPRSTLDLN